MSSKAEDYKMNYIEMIRGITDFDINVLCSIKKTYTKDTEIQNKDDTPIKNEENIKKEEDFSDNDQDKLDIPKSKLFQIKIEKTNKFFQDNAKSPNRDVSIQFGQKMHPSDNLDKEEFDDEAKLGKLSIEIQKTQSLIHSEAIVFMLLCNNNSRLMDDHKDGFDHSMFSTFFHFLLRDKKIKTLEDVLNMIDASHLPEIRILYMHIASIVAFHHYIRVEVHRTGNYKAKKTIDLLESYKTIMILGLLKTNLSIQGTTYLKEWGKTKS